MTVKETQTHERRFIITDVAPGYEHPHELLVRQCYFGDNGADVEVRVITETDGSATATITEKTGVGVTRRKRVHHASADTAHFLIGTTRMRIEKFRAFDGPWIIDQLRPPFTGIVAKVRLPSPDAPFAMLPWMRGWREVTNTLTNRIMAQAALDIVEAAANVPIRDIADRRKPLFALTGGPLSGKTKAMAVIESEFGNLVHCGEEAVTMLSTRFKAKPPINDRAANRRYQQMVYRVQRGLEDACIGQAVTDGKRAVVPDRGTPDGIAYLEGGAEEFERIIGTTRERELARYTAAIYLHSPSEAVFDAERGNNAARYETDYAANRAVADRTFAAWDGHHRLIEIRSTERFADKLDALREAVRGLLEEHAAR